jgi:L-iditol 2-dehydrogenase
MKCVVVTQPGKIEIREVDKPVPGPYQALVRMEAAALCNATDSKLYTGHFPGVENYPLVLGHETAGIVEAVGDQVKCFQLGDRVIGGMLGTFSDPALFSGWGGFSEYVLAHDHDAMVAAGIANEANGWFDACEIQNAISKNIPPDEAVLACTWREVLGAFRDFRLKPGKKVIVFGAGPVGLSFAKLGKLFGLGQIDIVEPLQEKRHLAMEMGADHGYTPEEVQSSVFLSRNARSYDTVIDAVGLEDIINNGLPLLKMGSDLCVYGVMTKNPTIQITKGPYNFDIHIHQWPTRSEERAAMNTLAGWIDNGSLKASDFVSHRFTMDRITEAFEAVKRGEVIKTILTF